MSDSRARANHELYLSKIVLAAWHRDLEQQQIPVATLAQAFEPGAREHLVAAYGWFLLAVSQLPAQPEGPPRRCDELPPVPAGKVLPGEINEFRRLETSGWLGDMLRTREAVRTGPRQQGNLASVAGDLPGNEEVAHWLQQLAALFARVGDSLDEY